MEKTTHTHELRLHNYRKGVNHSELIHKGSKQDCEKALIEIAVKHGVGASFLTSNGGYTLVDLYKERKRKIELAGPKLLEALQYCLEIDNVHLSNDVRFRIKEAIKATE